MLFLLNLTAGCPLWVRTTRSSEPSCSWRTTLTSWGSSREKRTRRTSDRTSSMWHACPAQSGTTDGCTVKRKKSQNDAKSAEKTFQRERGDLFPYCEVSRGNGIEAWVFDVFDAFESSLLYNTVGLYVCGVFCLFLFFLCVCVNVNQFFKLFIECNKWTF